MMRIENENYVNAESELTAIEDIKKKIYSII